MRHIYKRLKGFFKRVFLTALSISANKTGGDKAERKLQNVDNHGIFQSNPKLIQSKKRFKIFEQRIAPGASENPFPKRKSLNASVIPYMGT
ncbi:MAG: hypothetical protein ACLR06_07915 [Christensenellaceae bacterium]